MKNLTELVFILDRSGSSYSDVKRIIERQKEKGWEFIFLAANIDAAEAAEHIGISADRAVDYHSDKIGTKKAYFAMNKFVSFARSAPLYAPLDEEWREELDEDFKKRKK